MIKVIQISTDTNIGGAGIWLLNFLQYYNRKQLDVTVVIPKSSALKERIAALDVRYIEAEGIADCSFSIAGISTLKKIIAAEKPCVVHTHASLSARIAAKMCGVPVVNTRHCIEPRKSGIKRTVYGIINRALSNRAIAVSTAVYQNLLDDGIPQNRLTLVYNGVPPLRQITAEERKAVRQKFGIEGCIAIGIFARLEPVKNHMLFLEAAQAAYQQNPNLRFIIVGNGSLEESLKATTKTLGISDAVIFTGYVQDITDLMNSIDINALTSDREAMSISLAEGMTIGKPCITTDAGGPREVVENGVSGIVVPVGDKEALTNAFLQLAADAELRSRYGEKGIRIATEKFSPAEMCEKLMAVYTELCNSGKDKR